MIKIYADAGHDNKGLDPGAVKYVTEGKVNVKVINYMCEALERDYVCEVYKDITADSTTTIAKRANKWGADLFISVHFNAGGGDGYEALVYGEKNKDLGKMFEKYVKTVGQNSRGVKYRPDLNVLALTNMPAILNEIAFVDNKKDIKDFDEDKELKVMGEALAKAAADYLNLKKKATTFKVRVKVDSLNVRSGPGTNYDVKSRITDKGLYTIVELQGSWGKLKSGAGWINTSSRYCEKA